MPILQNVKGLSYFKSMRTSISSRPYPNHTQFILFNQHLLWNYVAFCLQISYIVVVLLWFGGRTFLSARQVNPL